MRLTEHRWQQSWDTKLNTEFTYRIDRINSPGDNYLKFIIACRLWPQGYLAPVGYQLFRSSMELSSIPNAAKAHHIEDEIECHLHKNIRALRKEVEKTIQCGYSTIVDLDNFKGYFPVLVPILNNWRIDS